MSGLVLRSLTKAYGGQDVVRELDLSIEPGECVSLLGPSGCGKTTTLRMIAGLESPSRGTIQLAGTNIADLAPGVRGVGLVSQHFALFPHMNVERNVAFGLKVRDVPEAQRRSVARAMLDRVQLGELAHRMPWQLSGGQMQRVALARTLITRPAVLLLDEPLSSLDASLRADMRELIDELRREFGTTTLLVTHDQVDAFSLSDRVAVMLDGAVAQIDTPSAIYDRPLTARLARFLGDTNLLDAQVIRSSGRARLVLPTGAELELGASHAQDDRECVCVMVRPERVGMRQTARGPDAVAGTVRNVTFTGSSTSYLLEVGEARVRATETGPARWRADDRVWVEFDPEAIHILPPETEPGGRPRDVVQAVPRRSAAALVHQPRRSTANAG